MQRHLVQCSIKCGRGTGINVVIRWICPIYFVGHSALLRANAVPMISFRWAKEEKEVVVKYKHGRNLFPLALAQEQSNKIKWIATYIHLQVVNYLLVSVFLQLFCESVVYRLLQMWLYCGKFLPRNVLSVFINFVYLLNWLKRKVCDTFLASESWVAQTVVQGTCQFNLWVVMLLNYKESKL